MAINQYVVNKINIIILVYIIDCNILWNYIVDARFSLLLYLLHSTQIYYCISFSVIRKCSTVAYSCFARTWNVRSDSEHMFHVLVLVLFSILNVGAHAIRKKPKNNEL